MEPLTVVISLWMVWDVPCRVLDTVEDLTNRWLLKHLANKRNGGGKVGLDYIPWYLIGSSFVDRLPLVTCFPEVCGVLINVFGTIVYLQPSRRHHHETMRFRRVNRDNGLR
jgi:hypothetical protein